MVTPAPIASAEVRPRPRLKLIGGLLAAALCVVFFVVNWSVFATTARFSFLVASVETPVGVVVILLLALAVMVIVAYAALWHRSLLLDYRQQTKELRQQRTLADDAEASRIAELRTQLHAETERLISRFESSLEAVRAEVRNTENSLAAVLGEMDDRMQRGEVAALRGHGGRPPA